MFDPIQMESLTDEELLKRIESRIVMAAIAPRHAKYTRDALLMAMQALANEDDDEIMLCAASLVTAAALLLHNSCADPESAGVTILRKAVTEVGSIMEAL